jgi:hypothetical protein
MHSSNSNSLYDSMESGLDLWSTWRRISYHKLNVVGVWSRIRASSDNNERPTNLDLYRCELTILQRPTDIEHKGSPVFITFRKIALLQENPVFRLNSTVYQLGWSSVQIPKTPSSTKGIRTVGPSGACMQENTSIVWATWLSLFLECSRRKPISLATCLSLLLSKYQNKENVAP